MLLNGCGKNMNNSFLSGCRKMDISVKEGTYGKDH